jgi:hypothetical protein
MKGEEVYIATQNGDIAVDLNQLRPLIHLLLEFAKQGPNALPLFISDENEDVQDIIEKSLKNSKKFLPMIEKKLKTFLPVIPKLPPFTIKE